jgi:6-phosphofructokinase 1
MTTRALLLHGGGPTPVINATLVGVVREARRSATFTSLLAARYGVTGILRRDFANLFDLTDAQLVALRATPSSALGTGREILSGSDLEACVHILGELGIGVVLYNGGNGSMLGARQLALCADQSGVPLRLIGIPKTIDNDIAGTDHTPGYASAARFFAHAVRDIGEDNRALPGQVEIVETLGRDSGWIVAATALARTREDDAPHLIYLPEQLLPEAQFLADVERVYSRLGRCVVAVCEGQLNERGQPFGADTRPGSGGSLAMNLGHRLAMLVMEKLKLRARSEKPGLLGRSGAAWISDVDRAEAELCGEAAVRAASVPYADVSHAGEASGQMITLWREPGPEYRIRTGVAPLHDAAGRPKLFPAEWRTNSAESAVAPEFVEWARPLIGQVPAHPRI